MIGGFPVCFRVFFGVKAIAFNGFWCTFGVHSIMLGGIMGVFGVPAWWLAWLRTVW